MATGQADLSMVETLQLWNEAVSQTEKGNYEQALEKFLSLEETDSTGSIITSARNLFNIGQIYLSMGRTNMAAQVSFPYLFFFVSFVNHVFVLPKKGF